MCSNCHKRVAVIFVTKVENGEKASQGLCVKCAKELGLPIENMLGDIYNKMGITPEQMENMENELSEMVSDGDDGEDGGAPAIDFPKLFKDSGFMDNFKAMAEKMPPTQGDGSGANIVPVRKNGGENGKKEQNKEKNQQKQ